MSHKPELRELAISDTGFVFDPRTGATFTVNETGLIVLQALREGATREKIVERLAERFDRPRDDLAEDISDFVQLLRQHALLSTDSATK